MEGVENYRSFPAHHDVSARKILEQKVIQKIATHRAAHGKDEEDGKLAGVEASDMVASKEGRLNRNLVV